MSKETGYDFFQNKDCPYFPCHETRDTDDFSCLFCFCPLYALGKGCRGNYSFTEDGIKDCSRCLYPHRRQNYGKIVQRFGEIAELVKRQEER